MEMEEPEKQNVAERGKQKGSLYSLSSEKVAELVVQLERWWWKLKQVSCRRKNGRKRHWRVVRSVKELKKQDNLMTMPVSKEGLISNQLMARSRREMALGLKITISSPSSPTAYAC